jgi:hypothetical protein
MRRVCHRRPWPASKGPNGNRRAGDTNGARLVPTPRRT